MSAPNSANVLPSSATRTEHGSALLLFPRPKRPLAYRWYPRLVKRVVRFTSAALLQMIFLISSRDNISTSLHYGEAGRVYLFGVMIEQVGHIDYEGMLPQGSHSGIYGGRLVLYLVGGLLFVWMIWSWWQLFMHCNRLEYHQPN
jgi:hypothetical protein